MFCSKKYGNKKANNAKSGNKKKGKEVDQTKHEERFNHKNAAMLTSSTKVKAPFDEDVPFKWMRNEKLQRTTAGRIWNYSSELLQHTCKAARYEKSIG